MAHAETVGVAQPLGMMGRPNPDTSTNFQSRFRVEGTRRAKAKPAPTEPPRIVRLLTQAEEWQRMLDAGEVGSRAEIARKEGVSAMRVTQILALLKLPAEMKEWIRGLPPGTSQRLVTERALRGHFGSRSSVTLVGCRGVGYPWSAMVHAMNRTTPNGSKGRGRRAPRWIGGESAHVGPLVLGPRDVPAWRRARAQARRSLARFWAAGDLERKPATVVDAGGEALVLPGWFRTAWHVRPWGGVLVRLLSAVIPVDPSRTNRLLAVSPELAPAALWSATNLRLHVHGPLHLAEVMVKHPEGTTVSARSIPIALPAGRYHLDFIPHWEHAGATFQSLRLRRDGEPSPVVAKARTTTRSAKQPPVAEVTREIRSAARKLCFVETTGGPLLLAPREAAASWHGIFDHAGEPIYESAPCDYDRAIAGDRSEPFLLDVGTMRALILPGSLPTAWYPTRDGGLLIRWAGAEGASPLLAGVLGVSASAWRKTRLRLRVGGSGELLLFDSSADGARPSRRRADTLKIALPPGVWAVDGCAARGRSLDRGVESTWSVELVRLRRA